MRMNRRTLLKAMGASAACAALQPFRMMRVVGQPSADLVLTNGAITTVNDASPHASAMAVKDGRILAVGTNDAVAPYIGPATRTVDLKGRGVSPGLIDAHNHLIGFGQMQIMSGLRQAARRGLVVSLQGRRSVRL
ncbi:MAG: hypothetical protein AB1486_13855 [Planctomycetota bacterium]